MRQVTIGLLALVALGGTGWAQSPRQAPSATATGQPPAAQQRLIDIVREYAAQYRSAPNDMAKGATRPSRARAICSALSSPTVNGWVGEVETLTSNNEGHGVLAIRVAPEVLLKTWSTAFTDSGDNTLIRNGSPLFAAAVGLRKGQRVSFDGRLFQSREDCFREVSLTVSGAMAEPDFLFRFTALRPLD